MPQSPPQSNFDVTTLELSLQQTLFQMISTLTCLLTLPTQAHLPEENQSSLSSTTSCGTLFCPKGTLKFFPTMSNNKPNSKPFCRLASFHCSCPRQFFTSNPSRTNSPSFPNIRHVQSWKNPTQKTFHNLLHVVKHDVWNYQMLPNKKIKTEQR